MIRRASIEYTPIAATLTIRMLTVTSPFPVGKVLKTRAKTAHQRIEGRGKGERG